MYTKRRLITAFILCTIMAVAIMTGYSSGIGGDTTVYTPDGERIVAWQELPESGSPSDFDLFTDLKYAAQKIYTSEFFKAETTGKVIANVGMGIKYTQNVHNKRIVKDGAVFSEAISSSSLKSVADQIYIEGDAILVRPADKINGDSAVFADSVYGLDRQTFYERYGVIPNELCKYVIDETTVLSVRDENTAVKTAAAAAENGSREITAEVPEKLVADENGHYRFTLELDPDKATRYYRNEVRTRGGADRNPVFYSVSITVEIDENFDPISVHSKENYDIAIPVLGAMNCTASLVEVFSDIDADGEIPEQEFFREHVGDLGGEIEIKSPADYLAAAFASYLDGSENLDLSADIAVKDGDAELVGFDGIKLSVNVGTMNIRVKLGKLYIEYADDKIYVTLNNVKGYITENALKSLLEDETVKDLMSGIALPDFSTLLGDDILSTVFANCEMTTEDGVTCIRLPFALADGIEIDASLYIEDEGMKLKKITGTVSAFGKDISVKAEPARKLLFPAVSSEYKDLSKLVDYVPAALDLALGSTRYGVKGTAAFNGTEFGLDAYIDRTDGIAADVDITALGQKINVKYTGGAVYAALGNIGVKATADELPELLAAAADAIGFDPAMLDAVKKFLPSSIEGCIGMLETLNVSDSQLEIGLNVSVVPVNITVTRDGGKIKGVKLVADADILGNKINAAADLELSVPAPRTIKADGDYAEAKELIPLIKPVTALVGAKDLSVAASGTVDIDGSKITVDGGATLDLNGETPDISAAFDITVLGNTAHVVYANGTAYAGLNNIKFKTDAKGIRSISESVTQILSALGISLPDINTDTDALAAAVLGSIRSFDVKNGVICLSLDLNGAAIDITANAASGEIGINGSAGNATFDLDLTVKAEKAAAFEAPTDAETYSDIAELKPVLDAAAPIVAAKAVAFTFSAEINGFTAVGTAAVNFDGGLKAHITIPSLIVKDCPSIALDLTLIGKTVYVSVSGGYEAAVSGSIDDIAPIMEAFGDIIPENIKTAISNALDTIGNMTGSLDAATIDTVIGAIKSLKADGGKLVCAIGTDGATATLDMNTDLTSIHIDATVKDNTIGADISGIAAGGNVTVPNGEFIPVSSLTALSCAMPLVNKQGYNFELGGTALGTTLGGNIAVAVEGGFAIGANVKIGDVSASAAIKNGKLYVSAADVAKLSIGLGKAEVLALLDDLSAAAPVLGDEKVRQVIDFLYGDIGKLVKARFALCPAENGIAAVMDLTPLGLDAVITARLGFENGAISGATLEAVLFGKTFGIELGTVIENGALCGITLGGGDITATLVSTEKQTVTVTGDYISATDVTALVAPIYTLVQNALGAKTVSLALDASVTTDSGKTVDIGGTVGVHTEVKADGTRDVSAEANIVLFKNTANTLDANMIYNGGVIYIRVGNIRLKFDTAKHGEGAVSGDVERLYAVLEGYLPDYLKSELANLLGLGNGTSALGDISLIVNRIKQAAQATDAASAMSVLFEGLRSPASDSTIKTLAGMVKLYKRPSDNAVTAKLSALGLDIDVTPYTADGDLVSVGLRAGVQALGLSVGASAYAVEFSDGAGYAAPDETQGQYVSIVEFVEIIDRAVNTFKTKLKDEVTNKEVITFELKTLDFTYKADDTVNGDGSVVKGTSVMVKNADPDKRAVTGRLEPFETTDTAGNEKTVYKLNLEAHITVDASMFENAGVITLDLYVLNNEKYSNKAFLCYREGNSGYGENVSIDYGSVMQILAAALDILGVDEATSELLVGDYKADIDTSVFDSMDIAGLDGVRDALDGIASLFAKLTTAETELGKAWAAVCDAGSVDNLKTQRAYIIDCLEAALEALKSEKNTQPVSSPARNDTVATVVKITDGIALGSSATELWADVNNEITTGANGTACIKITHDDNALTGISIDDLALKGAAVNGSIVFTAGKDVRVEFTDATEAAITGVTDATDKSAYSDLSQIKHLLFDVMNTANVKEFEIGGLDTSDVINVKLNLGALKGLANMDLNIRYDIKVKIINAGTDENGKPIYKTAATVELNYQNCTANILGVECVVVTDCTTRLFFYDNVLYVQGVSGWDDEKEVTVGETQKIYTARRPVGVFKYDDFTSEPRYSDYNATVKPYIHYVKPVYTVDEFLWMIQNDMGRFLNEFLFYLVPLSKDFTVAHINLQSVIAEQITGTGGTADTTGKTLAQIFKGYSYDGSAHKISLGLKELAGNAALSDLNVSLLCLGDGDDDQTGNLRNNYVKGLHIDTSIKDKLVTVDLDATLRNIRESADGKTVYSAGFAPTDVTTVNGSFTFNGKSYISEYDNYEQDVLYTLDGSLYSIGNSLYTENGRLTRLAIAAHASYKEDKNIGDIAGEPDYKFGDVSYQNHYTYTLNKGYTLSAAPAYYVGTNFDGTKYIYRYASDGTTQIRVELRSITNDFLADVNYDENGNVILTNKPNGVQWSRIWQNAA